MGVEHEQRGGKPAIDWGGEPARRNRRTPLLAPHLERVVRRRKLTVERATARLADHFEQLLELGLGAVEELGKERVLERMAAALGVHAEDVLARGEDRGSFPLLVYGFVGSQTIAGVQEQLRASVLVRIRRQLIRAFYLKLLDTPLRAWRFFEAPEPDGGLVAVPLAGPKARDPLAFHVVLTPGGAPVEVGSCIAGWQVRSDPYLALIGAAELEEDGIFHLLEHAVPVSRRLERAFWEEVQPVLLRAAAAPPAPPIVEVAEPARAELELPIEREVGFGTWWRSELVERTWAMVLEQGWKSDDPPLLVRCEGESIPLAYFRETVARTRCEADISAIAPMLRAWVAMAAGSELHPCGEGWGTVEQVLEVITPEALLARFGLHSTGELAAAPEEVLLSEPAARLLLRAEHPGAGGTIAEALAWASERSDDADAEAVRRAWRVYEVEARWLATWERPESQEPRLSARRRFEHLLHGLEHVFDPRVQEIPIESLAMREHLKQRLLNALVILRGAGEEEPEGGWRWTVADLPRRYKTLVSSVGVGPTTARELTAVLLERAARWRD